MTGKAIDVSSAAVTAMLAQLRGKFDDMSPFLLAIGDDMVDGIKQRFATATAPDGTPWRTNSRATLERYIMQRGGFSKKTGKILAKGQKLAISKKPLQGHSGDLARQFSSQVYSGTSLTVGSSMIYAAMQQYGGSKARFRNLWGDIPARPFFPIQPDGTLYPQAEAKIVEMLRQYLTI
ncbi:MAG: phage virion morphogenesis protein [Pseudomonadota bacterium]|nr:phage virion morphogenesis protein [Pseudomonadota bacterium]